MRLVRASPGMLDDLALRRASMRGHAVLVERDVVRQRALIAADTLALLDADAVQSFELEEGCLYAEGERYGLPLPDLAVRMQTALLPAALAAGRSLISNHPQLDADLADLAARCDESRITTHLLLVRAYGQTHGAYAVHWLGRERPSYEARSGFYHYWDTIGIAVAAAHERARLDAEMAEIREYAFFDSLTGLPNAQALERELAANLLTHPFSVLALDFDGLREANAAFGYTAGGDLLIRTVGSALKTFSRRGEFTARMHTAGDEFALLLPGVGKREAKLRAAELEAELDALRVPDTHQSLYRGASVGHASRHRQETPGQVLGRAIEQMRARKLVRSHR
jgi:diguanylate cyclase (GGDEF)-like protein